MNKKTTLVTCYYKIPSKQSHEKYNEYITNFFENLNPDVNLVIFTSSDLIAYFHNFIKNKDNIKIIVREFNDLFIKNKYNNIWEKQYEMDLLKYCKRSYQCYIIWNSKVEFVLEVIKLNLFDTDKFIWIDIGCVRNKNCFEYFKNFGNYNKISNDKIDIVLLDGFKDHNQKFFVNEVHFSGAIFAGTKNTFIKYHELYYKKFDEYLDNNQFIGCDQQIISSVYLENTCFFNPILPLCSNIDVWFYMIMYLSNNN